ncbi:MAG TPA: formate-dependent phosphoribosylglycinamide formyltransferase [Mycobacterium sp.]|nr:formate-dependent phosphoribosylglycinamide formyltransferase [Mycobacterium sp.]
MNDEEGGPVTEDRDQQGPSRTRVMLLGSGELGRELVVALQRLGTEVIAVDRYADGRLHGVADQALVVNMTDTDELTATIRWLQPKFVVTATEVVATDALTAATDTGFTEVMPSTRAARLTADVERMRRLAADELGLPTVPFWFAGSADELRSVAEHAGFPMVVKPVAGSPGEGQSVMVRADDVEPAWQRAMSAAGPAAPERVLAETVVDVDSEVTLLTVHSDGPAGAVLEFCAPIGHRSIEGPDGLLVLESWQPHAMSAIALDAARSIAARVVRALGGRGLFGVELLIRGDEVYFSNVTARPYDVALLTLRTQRLSGFELQARAILGLAVDTVMISPGAARLVYASRRVADAPAEERPDTVAVLADAFNVTESDAVVFGHHEGHPRRRLGVALATAPDVTAARDRARQVSTALDKLWRS